MVSTAPTTQHKSMDGKENDKATSMTLNIAANEFIPAKDVHGVPSISKIPASVRPISRGHTKDENSVASVMHAFEDQMNEQNQDANMNEEKSRLPSKIPRLAGNEFYFPRKESEMSIREHREIYNQINSDIPIDKSEIDLAEFLERHSESNAKESHFPGLEKDQNIYNVPFEKSQIDLANFIGRQMQRRTGEGKIVTLGGEEIFTLPSVPEKEEDEVEIDKFIRKMSKDIWSTAVIEPSNPSMPLIEADMSIKEFLIHRLKTEEVKSADKNINWLPYGVEQLPTKQSSFSLQPQTSLTGSTAESREAIVDDDGFERNFVSAFKL